MFTLNVIIAMVEIMPATLLFVLFFPFSYSFIFIEVFFF